MPPGSADEQPRDLQESRNQDMMLSEPREENTGPAADPSSDSNPRKHEHPEEPESEGTSKRTKLSSDNEAPTCKSTILSMEDYTGMTGTHDQLQNLVKEQQEQLEAMHQENQATKLILSKIQEELDIKCRELLAKTQAIEAEQKKHQATRCELSERNEEIEARLRSSKRKNEQLEAKDRTIEDMQRDFEASREELDGIRRERDSAKKQAHDSQNALAKTQEKLNTRDQELDDAKSQLEKSERIVGALREVNDGNGAHNTKLQLSSDKAKSALAKARKGLCTLLHTATNTYELTDIQRRVQNQGSQYGQEECRARGALQNLSEGFQKSPE